MEKSTKLRSLAASLQPARGREFNRQAAPHTQKCQRLQSALARSTAEVSHHRPRRKSPQRETVVMTGGWYNAGFPVQTVYRVEDLVQLWRACMAQHFRQQTPSLPFPFYLRPKILEWLRADGHQICEQIVAYAVRMWEPLKEEFEIDAEHPTMNIIWGFRRVFYKRMQQVGKTRKWGGHWNGEVEGEYTEAVS